ncbi:MAG: hypothetical protein BZY75_00500, partial [SAR202 cluster bacterium Io17-Chloro-G7]
MRTTRNNREKLNDALCSLVLLDLCAAESGIVGDRLKVTKLIFLATLELLQRQIKGLNYSFYRYPHGPFTIELYETWGEICWMGYLDVPAGAKKLSQNSSRHCRRYHRSAQANWSRPRKLDA